MKGFAFALYGFCICFIYIMSSCENQPQDCSVRPAIQAGFEEVDQMVIGNKEKQIPAFIDSLYSQNQPHTTGELQLKYEYLLSNLYTAGNDEKKLNAYIDSLESSLIKNNYSCLIGYGSLQLLKSYLASKNNQYITTLEQYEKAMQYLEQSGDPCKVKIQQSPLIRLLFQQKNYLEANRHLHLEIKMLENCSFNDVRLRYFYFQGLINALGVGHERLGNLDSAAYYYNKGLDFLREHQDKYPKKQKFTNLATGVMMGNLGGVYLKTGQYEKAQSTLESAIQLNFEQDKKDALLTMVKLLETYKALGKKQKEDSLNQIVLREMEFLPDFHLGHSRYAQYAHLSAIQIGDFENAYKWHVHLVNSENELDKPNQQLNQTDLINEIKLIRRENELKILQKDNVNKTFLLWGMVSAGVIFIVFILLLWVKSRQMNNLIAHLTKLNKEITDKNEQLFVNMQTLQDTQDENKEMMRILAHDLRTPVSSVINLADLILSVELDKDEREELALQLKKSGKHVLDIINDQLASVNKKVDKPMLETNIQELLHSCVQALTTMASSKNISIKTDVSPHNLLLHREKVWRVFSNLITNAIKFSPKNAEITIFSEDIDNAVQICVRDQGIGIAKDDIETLFDENRNNNRSGTQNEPSFGMGLAISKEIIEEHHGKIICESEPGKGSSFYVILPLRIQVA